VLKGGDHGAKTAAQKRFKKKDGPRILICTAAGREGINLQFARVLINHDLTWNPMDMEQRAGRIHRYGQQSTAQVYNLVARDTIEGQIFLLLEEKLQAIAETLGKVDERGEIAEDLRSQVLGQLSERLSYDRLYQEAVQDPTLKRTKEELEVAMTNASMAREVVFELFQDLEKFNLSDYQRFDDGGKGMKRLVAFAKKAAEQHGARFVDHPNDVLVLHREEEEVRFTTNRDLALEEEKLQLLGVEHPLVEGWLRSLQGSPASARALVVELEGGDHTGAALTVWKVIVQSPGGRITQRILRLGVKEDGSRDPLLERACRDLLKTVRSSTTFPQIEKVRDQTSAAEKLLHRELEHQGLLVDGATYSGTLVALLAVG
jgi:superfamily II DNA/RNA helicase